MFKRSFQATAAILSLAGPATAQIMVSGNDAKVVLVNGVTSVVVRPAADTITVHDLGVLPPRLVAKVKAPNSVVGPPFSVALTPDGRILAVTVMNGSNKPEASPFRGPGLVRTDRMEGLRRGAGWGFARKRPRHRAAGWGGRPANCRSINHASATLRRNSGLHRLVWS